MQQTANYNLNLPEGTDVVNPLVDYNPNFSTIDSAMKANADRTVGRATCIKSGTTHVVTRANTDSNIINFTATGDWNAGDTMTIDSTIVSVYLPDGTAALDGAYLINSEVFGILNGTRFTLYSNINDDPSASDISYDNTTSGMTASNVQDAIDKLSAKKPSFTTTILVQGASTNGSVQFDSSQYDFFEFIMMLGKQRVTSGFTKELYLRVAFGTSTYFDTAYSGGTLSYTISGGDYTPLVFVHGYKFR